MRNGLFSLMLVLALAALVAGCTAPSTLYPRPVVLVFSVSPTTLMLPAAATYRFANASGVTLGTQEITVEEATFLNAFGQRVKGVRVVVDGDGSPLFDDTVFHEPSARFHIEFGLTPCGSVEWVSSLTDNHKKAAFERWHSAGRYDVLPPIFLFLPGQTIRTNLGIAKEPTLASDLYSDDPEWQDLLRKLASIDLGNRQVLARALDDRAIEAGWAFVEGAGIGGYMRPGSLVLDHLKILHYGSGPFPISIRNVTSAPDGWVLAAWTSGTKAFKACETAPFQSPWTGPARYNLTSRGPPIDPPFPLSLRKTIDALENGSAEASVRNFLRSRQDAYLADWGFISKAKVGVDTWNLHFVDPAVGGDISVSCSGETIALVTSVHCGNTHRNQELGRAEAPLWRTSLVTYETAFKIKASFGSAWEPCWVEYHLTYYREEPLVWIWGCLPEQSFTLDNATMGFVHYGSPHPLGPS